MGSSRFIIKRAFMPYPPSPPLRRVNVVLSIIWLFFFDVYLKGTGTRRKHCTKQKEIQNWGGNFITKKKLTSCRVKNLMNKDGKRRRGDVWSWFFALHAVVFSIICILYTGTYCVLGNTSFPSGKTFRKWFFIFTVK